MSFHRALLLRFALPYLLLIGLGNVYFKLIAHWDIHPLLFTCQGMMLGAIVLLAISRPGPLGMETVRSAGTWVYGITFLLSNVFFIYALSYSDSVFVNLLGRANILFTVLLCAIFLGRRVHRLSLIPLAVLAAALVGVALTMPPDIVGVVVLLVIAISLTQSIKVLAQETHGTSNQTRKNFVHECRVTGFVLGITAAVIALFAVGIGVVANVYQLTALKALVPSVPQILSLPSFVFAIGYGLVWITFLRFMEFRWIKEVKAEAFMMMLTFIPLVTLIMELLADALGIVSFGGISALQLGIGALVIAAAMAYVYLENRAPKQGDATALTRREKRQLAEDARMAAHAVQHCGGNEAQAARLLGIRQGVLRAALRGPKTHIPLPPELSLQLQQAFSRTVAVTDGLTGLANRSSLVQALKEELAAGGEGLVFYLDLNGFKPINDTYGHAAGDALLQALAQRLQAAVPAAATVARLGGDEFAVLWPQASLERAAKHAKTVQQAVAEPTNLPGVDKPVKVGTSLGVAAYPQHGTTPETLLAYADAAMYEHKKEKSVR